MFTSLKRIFRSAWLSFSRDGDLSVATIFILVMAIFLISSIFLLKNVSRLLITNLQEKADISVYFKIDALEEDILKIKDDISNIPEIKEINYISREEAKETFIKKHENEPDLITAVEEVGGNPFLASLNIGAFEASQYTAIANLLESSDFKNLIEKIDYYQRKSIIERIFSLTSLVNKSGIIFSIILIIVAILVTFNTIRLAIYNLREEIGIQRLVGASNWFIRGPFIAQGVISGIFAALISLLIFSLVCWYLSPKIAFFFPDLNIFQLFTNGIWMLILIQFATGILLGAISSIIAVRKYLRV